MNLSRLIDAMEIIRINGAAPDQFNDVPAPDISSIHYRSGDVMPGGIFFAIKGTQADGHKYILDAVSRGAAAVVVEAGHPVQDVDAWVLSAIDTRRALAAGASEFFGNPSEEICLIGITGTNGKTTTAYLIEHMLRENGMDVGVISTINYRYHGRVYDNPLTTPESLDLQKILAEMKAAGVTHVVMEVSSHGVALQRIRYCLFDMGIFTNLSQDHLDFHGDMDAYWKCKKRFFTEYLLSGSKKNKAVAVINTDNEKGMELATGIHKLRVVSVGSQPSNNVSVFPIASDPYGMTGELRFESREVPFKSGLIGRFNLENIGCSAGAAFALRLSLESVAAAIAAFDHVPGRLERVSGPSGPHVFLDYAHTPDALENVLDTLKDVCTGRLICVFGCGGDRDTTKRAQMGKIAALNSNFVVVTSDNPRTEDPDAIIEQIRNGVVSVISREYGPDELDNGIFEKGFTVEPDREKAIRLGVAMAGADDTVLIAGKGHENYQIIGKETFPFDDREKAAAALAAL